jgi:hypothetical protein
MKPLVPVVWLSTGKYPVWHAVQFAAALLCFVELHALTYDEWQSLQLATAIADILNELLLVSLATIDPSKFLMSALT